MTIISGWKKNFWLKLNSVNARQTVPIVDDTKDMNVGNIKKDIVKCTRSKLVGCSLLARIQREMIWTVYSTVKPTLSTKDMLENPVRFTPAKTLTPTTVDNVISIVHAIKAAPTKVPLRTLNTGLCPSNAKRVKRKNHEMMKPASVA